MVVSGPVCLRRIDPPGVAADNSLKQVQLLDWHVPACADQILFKLVFLDPALGHLACVVGRFLETCAVIASATDAIAFRLCRFVTTRIASPNASVRVVNSDQRHSSSVIKNPETLPPLRQIIGGPRGPDAAVSPAPGQTKETGRHAHLPAASHSPAAGSTKKRSGQTRYTSYAPIFIDLPSRLMRMPAFGAETAAGAASCSLYSATRRAAARCQYGICRLKVSH
jgi:hypothetical protein